MPVEVPLPTFDRSARSRWWGRRKVVFAASGGGHFSLLDALAGVVPRESREWVTVEGPRSRSLTADAEAVQTLPAADASHLDWRNPLRSVIAAVRMRPNVVVSSGAGVVVTFVIVCWLLGARVVFLETMARVSAPSRTGRILARIATLHVVQWPELLRVFPKATLCRPVLLPRRFGRRAGGVGTFVSVGTHSEPFDRLLRAVEVAIEQGVLPEPCVVQSGSSTVCSPRMSARESLAPDEFEAGIAAAQCVVGHCGAGLISAAISAGRRPIVMARRADHHEHVDDHQLQLAQKLQELQLVVCVEDGIDEDAVRRASLPTAELEALVDLPEAEEVLATYLAPLRCKP